MNRGKNSQKVLAALCLSLLLVLAAALGAGEETDGNGNTIRHNPDGSITVITNDANPVIQNDDGSITVESGQIMVIENETTRAPLEGDEWVALLESVSAKNGSYTPTFYTDPVTGTTTEVPVKYMGIGRSMIVLDGQETLVNTVDLKWATEAPEDMVLAAVHAPKDGYAWLYKSPSTKITNPKVEQIRTDTVLRVLSVGSNWAFVDHDGMRGYVKSSSLEFFYNDHVDFDPGRVSVKGRIQGRDTVHVRSRDKGIRHLAEYRVGTPITVFDIIDEWAEIDIAGWHCRIESKYVTLDRDNVIADAAEP